MCGRGKEADGLELARNRRKKAPRRENARRRLPVPDVSTARGLSYDSELELKTAKCTWAPRVRCTGIFAVEGNAMVVAEELGLKYEDVSINFDSSEPLRLSAAAATERLLPHGSQKNVPIF